jgi:hypothetical protein
LDAEHRLKATSGTSTPSLNPNPKPNQIRQGVTISGEFVPKAMEVLSAIPLGLSLKCHGRGTKTGQSDPIVPARA